jgi:hypothetical protein
MVAAVRRGGLMEALSGKAFADAMAVLTGKAPAETREILIHAVVQVSIYALAAAYAFIVVRELAAGRRPIWLATWLAAAIGFGQILFITLPFRFPAAEPILRFLGVSLVLIPPLVVLPVCWKSPKWRKAALVVCAVILAPVGIMATVGGMGYGAVGSAVFLLCFWLGPLAAWIMVGVRLFGAHKFGHPVLASLFLYTFFLIDFSLYVLCMFPQDEVVGWDSMGLARPEMLLAAVAVLAFGLTESWTAQLGALVCGIFAWAIAVSLSRCSIGMGSLPQMCAAVAAFVVVIVPLVMRSRGQADRSEIVH